MQMVKRNFEWVSEKVQVKERLFYHIIKSGKSSTKDDFIIVITRTGRNKADVLFCPAAPGVLGQRQSGGFNGLHLWHGSLWKNQEGVLLLRHPLLPESHLGTQGSRRDSPHQGRIWRWGFLCDSWSVSCPHLCIIRPIVIFIFLFTSGDGVPTVFVAVAGRSNGLGPVMSGNTVYPVINCPPLTPDWGAQDVWSSLRMPSGELSGPPLPAMCVFVKFNIHGCDWASFPLAGLGCSTILSPDAAAQFAAQIFGLNDHLVWGKLRASMLNTWTSLKLADQKLQACSL